MVAEDDLKSSASNGVPVRVWTSPQLLYIRFLDAHPSIPIHQLL